MQCACERFQRSSVHFPHRAHCTLCSHDPRTTSAARGAARRAVEFSNEKMMRALKATAASITLLCASCVDVDVSRRRALQLHAFSAPVVVPPLDCRGPSCACGVEEVLAADASRRSPS